MQNTIHSRILVHYSIIFVATLLFPLPLFLLTFCQVQTYQYASINPGALKSATLI